MATQMGKKYVCATCGAEFMVTKAGSGDLSCCGAAVKAK